MEQLLTFRARITEKDWSAAAQYLYSHCANWSPEIADWLQEGDQRGILSKTLDELGDEWDALNAAE